MFFNTDLDGYAKTVAVPPLNALMGPNGLLFKKTTKPTTATFTLVGPLFVELVAAQPGNELYVYQLMVSPNVGLSASSFRLADTDGTAILGAGGITIPLLANTPFILPNTETPWTSTAAGKGIRFYVPAAIAASYTISITYLAVPPGSNVFT